MRAQQQHGDLSVGSGVEPTSSTPEDVAQARQQLRVLQWASPP